MQKIYGLLAATSVILSSIPLVGKVEPRFNLKNKSDFPIMVELVSSTKNILFYTIRDDSERGSVIKEGVYEIGSLLGSDPLITINKDNALEMDVSSMKDLDLYVWYLGKDGAFTQKNTHQLSLAMDVTKHKYYLKFELDKNEIPTLQAQKGGLFTTTHGHSTRGNIKDVRYKYSRPAGPTGAGNDFPSLGSAKGLGKKVSDFGDAIKGAAQRAQEDIQDSAERLKRKAMLGAAQGVAEGVARETASQAKEKIRNIAR